MSLRELFRHFTYQVFAPGALLREKYNAFRELLRFDDVCLERIAELEDIHYGPNRHDWARVSWICRRLGLVTEQLVNRLIKLNPTRFLDLPEYAKKIDFYIKLAVDLPAPDMSPPFIMSLKKAAGIREAAGGKAANLGRVLGAGLPTPDGFVVTTGACCYFIEANELRRPIDRLLRKIDLSRPDELPAISAELRRLILGSPVPEGIVEPLDKAARLLAETSGQGLLALRSSAMAEDSEASFAGQYESMLEVSPERAAEAYRRVLAAKYSVKALTYRIHQGLADEETAMAVLVMPMIEAVAAGVMYTLDPAEPDEPARVGLYAVPGLGQSLVDGCLAPEKTVLARRRPHEVLSVDSPDDDPVLPEGVGGRLAEMGMTLEKLFGRPQDVEWVLDRQGNLLVLQSRPLSRDLTPEPADLDDEGPDLSDETILLDGAERASGGVASGEVVHAGTVIDAMDLPAGAILVTPNLTPALSRHVTSLAAVVATTGSRAGHFASVAREFGLPVLVGAEDAFALLPPGATVTVDADSGQIFEGAVAAVLARKAAPHRHADMPMRRRLERLMPLVARLTLTDPKAPNFCPEGVHSIHDIVRFCHEMSVTEMFSLVGRGGRGLSLAKRLKTHLPFSMYVLDLGGGLFEAAAEEAVISPDRIKSAPMWSFYAGLSTPDTVWPEGLIHADWEEFDRIAAGIISPDDKLLASYAVISDSYAHLMIRFGYHFSVIDTVCEHDPKNNYIGFRFKGGGGSFEQRILRLAFITNILKHFDFEVETKGDLLDAKLSRETEAVIQKRLAMLGLLLAKARMLDMRMTGQDAVADMTREFLELTDR